LKTILPKVCPKCNSSTKFYRYGKDDLGYQKFQCCDCKHQFAPDRPKSAKQLGPNNRKYPSCPKCGKASFLHHDYPQYSNFRCSDKKCNHSFFSHKPTAVLPASQSRLLGKTDFTRMRYPAQIIINAIAMFYLGTTSFRKIALILRLIHNIKVSHTTISNWCKNFAPYWQNIGLELVSPLDFNSDEWHADETVVKIKGVKHWVWFVIDSETRFVLGFHLTPYRNSPQAFTTFANVANMGKCERLVSDRLPSYNKAVKAVLDCEHIKVESWYDDVTNNLIECFNKQFKAWYKTKNGFNSFESANNLIATFVFFFNFVRPHSALNGLTPAQVAGLKLTAKEKRKFPLVA